MGVPTDAVTREIGMCQKAPLAIEWAAVTVETLGEEEHDVGKLLHLVPYVTVWDFPETKRGDALPHPEGLPDGLVGLVLTHLRSVVLYTEVCVIVCGDGGGGTWSYLLFIGIPFQFISSYLITLGFLTLVIWVRRKN